MLKKSKNTIKKIPGIKTYLLYRKAVFFEFKFFKKIKLMRIFFNDLKKYRELNTNNNFTMPDTALNPRIFDKTTQTPLDYVYFYQNAWCAEKIFATKPQQHYDIGSQAGLIGTISQFTPTTMVDIRPLNIELKGLNFIKGDIVSLPFKDASLESISSICVIEHIGLGRYGDKLDPFGSEKAVQELKRVLATDGSLYISLPVDASNTVYFNAHRAFTREYVLKLFSPLQLIEEKYIYKNRLFNDYDQNRGFGTGLFYFKK